MDDAQTQCGGDGRVHTGSLPGQDVKAQGCALGHISHHCPLVIDLQTAAEDVGEVVGSYVSVCVSVRQMIRVKAKIKH